MVHAALLLLMLEAVTTVTSFHHQPEAQHLKSSAIHKLGRPITPSFRVKRTCRLGLGMFAFDGEFNRSLQHILRPNLSSGAAVSGGAISRALVAN
jgi:hypothetical protein